MAAAGLRLPEQRNDSQSLVRSEWRHGKVVLLPPAQGLGGCAAANAEPRDFGARQRKNSELPALILCTAPLVSVQHDSAGNSASPSLVLRGKPWIVEVATDCDPKLLCTVK